METSKSPRDDRSGDRSEGFRVRIDDLGTFARGSNNFMYPYQAATGKVYLTTYGPEPAKFYEIDPDTGAYTMYEPGDYQTHRAGEPRPAASFRGHRGPSRGAPRSLDDRGR